MTTTTLKAIETNGDWAVKDTSDGISVWWSNNDAQAEIQASDDPAAAVVAICDNSPQRGTWSN